jgi:YjbE family integral membrane protein
MSLRHFNGSNLASCCECAAFEQSIFSGPFVEIFSTAFLSALLTIIVIDLVLAGDNALVIGLAARNVPKHLQKRVIFWGTGGAIAIRIVFTLGIVWLLKIPGLMLIGGLLLLPVAYKLMFPSENESHGESATNAGFWTAMKTIIVADALMGVDNVLGVAGAAQGSFLLVVLGLIISIPIMVWGSTLVLKVVDRHPWIITVGAGVLVWTATQMILDEKLLAPYLPVHNWFDEVTGAAATFAIIGALEWRKRKLASNAVAPR